jgi:hypothetical protein
MHLIGVMLYRPSASADLTRAGAYGFSGSGFARPSRSTTIAAAWSNLTAPFLPRTRLVAEGVHRTRNVALERNDDMASIDVTSQEHWVDTGIRLEAGRTYELTASGEWKDASIPTGPDGYESANLLQRETEGLRRMPAAQWFALVGALDRRKETEFLIGSRVRYTATESGELTCFANDLIGFYRNNHGSVTLSVTEVTE